MHINYSWWFNPLLISLAGVVGAVYAFLSAKLQGRSWIRGIAGIAGLIVAIYSSYDIFQKYNQQVIAYVKRDGTILKNRNFKGTIGLPTAEKDATIFLIQGGVYGDASRITITPEKPIKTELYNAIGGIAIRFSCQSDAVPNFTIKVSN